MESSSIGFAARGQEFMGRVLDRTSELRTAATDRTQAAAAASSAAITDHSQRAIDGLSNRTNQWKTAVTSRARAAAVAPAQYAAAATAPVREAVVDVRQGVRCFATFIQRANMLLGAAKGIWNNGSTLYVAFDLLDKGYTEFAFLSIFFLFFPGLVTSIGFLVLHLLGHSRLGRLPLLTTLGYFVLLLVFFPIVPIVLCLYSFFTLRQYHLARLAKLFEGFLDDGPQFVLKLVVFVLYDIGRGDGTADFIFMISMITSFTSLVLYAVAFNDRPTGWLLKLLVCLPTFITFAGARALTLGVFLKQTLGHTTERVAGCAVLTLFCLINTISFKFCGQDLIRSFVFSLCSLLLPAGYSNDDYFFQCPKQPLAALVSDDGELKKISVKVQDDREDGRGDTYREGGAVEMLDEEPGGTQTNTSLQAPYDSHEPLPPVDKEQDEDQTGEEESQLLNSHMKSGVFLLLYTVSNALLLTSCSIYLAATRDLGEKEDNALVLPQILALVPGCFFCLSRAVLLPDLKPVCCNQQVWNVTKVVLCVVFAVFAYCSLIPSVLWGVIYKLVKGSAKDEQ